MARIKGLKGGKTNITVSYGGKSATFSNFTVNKKTVTFSAPTLRSVSKYNGNGQALINSGSCTTGGTMYYYVSTSSSTPTFNTGSWTTTVPSKTNAGTYYLWYYVYVSDTGVYTGTGINTVTKVGNGSVTIPKADNSITVTSTSATIYVHSSHTYNNTTQLSVNGAKGSVTYSSSDTGKATVNSSGLVTSKSAGTVTITATDAGNTNYKSSTASCTVKVVTDTVSSYGAVSAPSVSQKTNFPTGGVTLTSSNMSTYFTASGSTQTNSWASGYTSSGSVSYSWSVSSGTVASKGTTISNVSTVSINATVTATGEGSKTTPKTVTSGTQAGNYVTAITPKSSSNTDGTHFSYANIGAGAISASPSLTGGALYTFSSGSTKFDTSTSPSFGGSASYIRSYALASSQNGFTAVNSSTGVLTATSRGTTPGAARASANVTATLVVKYTHASTYSAGGTVTSSTKSNTQTCTQNENALTNTNYSPSNYTVSVSIGDGMNPGDGSATVTASASHKAYDYYTSGSYNNQHTVTDSVTWSITTQTFTPSGGSASTITRFSKSNNTLSHTSMTSNVGTDYVKITATNSSNTSTISTAEKSIINELGTQKYKNTSGTTGYNIVYTVPTVSIRSELSAAGGTATVTCSVTNNTNWYQKYTSGTYTGQKTSTETGTARWMITSNGNSRFSHPSSGGTSLSGVGTVYNTGTKISHSNMTTNATTDTVTVTAYNIGDISKTKTASASVSNALTGISISLGSNPINYNTTTTATVTATYTSGSSKDVTSSLSTSSSATSNYIKSGDTSVVTVS